MSYDIRELAMRLLGAASEGEQFYINRDGMCVLEDSELERLVRAAMREGMMRAADVCRVRCESRGYDATNHAFDGGSKVEIKAGESSACYHAIRAEAEKLEGKA